MWYIGHRTLLPETFELPIIMNGGLLLHFLLQGRSANPSKLFPLLCQDLRGLQSGRAYSCWSGVSEPEWRHCRFMAAQGIGCQLWCALSALLRSARERDSLANEARARFVTLRRSLPVSLLSSIRLPRSSKVSSAIILTSLRRLAAMKIAVTGAYNPFLRAKRIPCFAQQT